LLVDEFTDEGFDFIAAGPGSEGRELGTLIGME
jgi:hypothetical protein